MKTCYYYQYNLEYGDLKYIDYTQRSLSSKKLISK